MLNDTSQPGVTRTPCAPRADDRLRLEEQERFHGTVAGALVAGAAASLVVWVVWAISALATVHLPGTWLAGAGAHLRGPYLGGTTLQGGSGLCVGAIPIFPALAFLVAAVAARAYLVARRDGKVAVVHRCVPKSSQGNGFRDPRASMHCGCEARGSWRSQGYASGEQQSQIQMEQRPKSGSHSFAGPNTEPSRVIAAGPAPALVACMAAGALAGAMPWLLPAHPALGVLIGGMILGLLLTRRPIPGVGRGARRLAILGCGASTLTGVATIEAIASHGWLEAVFPAPLPIMILGAALGGFMVLGTAIAHVSTPADPVRAHYRERSKELRGELFDIARRAHETYRASASILDSRAGDRAEALRLREKLASVTRRVLDLALQCQSVAVAVGEATELKLAREIAELDRKVASSTDDVTRRQYERARATLTAQQSQLDRIRVGRDRAVATMHEKLALLERARLSLIGVASADHGRLMAELTVVSAALDESSTAMDAETEAMLSVSAC